MVIDALLWILLALSVVGLLGLLIRKVPVLRVIDTSKLNSVSQNLLKLRLLEQRLVRKLRATWEQAGRRLPAVGSSFGGALEKFKASFERVTTRVERKLERHTTPIQTTPDIMAQAEAALKAGNYEKAEAQYLEALRHDAHSLAAYEGLGMVYLDSREYEQAREVFEYLVGRGMSGAHLGLARASSGQGQLEVAKQEYQLALGHLKAAQPMIELAQVLQELGNPEEAFTQLKEARALEPRNPKLLDFYIELSIVNGQPIEAQSALDALREVNPENQKIPEFAQAVRKLTQKLKVKRPGPASRTTSFGLPSKRKG
jgi:tetratricopeptide (TPR) repeat protein